MCVHVCVWSLWTYLLIVLHPNSIILLKFLKASSMAGKKRNLVSMLIIYLRLQSVLLAFSQVPTWAPYYNVLYILPNVKTRCGGAGHLPKAQGCWQSQRGAKTQVPLCVFSWKWPVNEARIYHSMVCRAFCLVRFLENSEISLLL